MDHPHPIISPSAFPPDSTSSRAAALPLAVPGARAALVVAHPGHELVVHHWLNLARPRVFVMTDGSGHTGRSRLHLTTDVLTQAGAEPGSIYGRFPDPAIYAALLNHDFDLFINLAEELAAALVRARVEYVAGDALEGYNPIHDACRLVINAAVELANRMQDQRIANFDFLLMGQPGTCREELRAQAIWLRLDEDTFVRKIAAVRAYPYASAELDIILTRMSVDEYRTECLRPVTYQDASCDAVAEPPFYERYGEKQVAAGHYERVLRYREHFVPLAAALRDYVARRD